MKLKIALASLITAFTGLCFLNNLAAVFNWWRSFAAVDGDSTKLAAAVGGFLPWLDWTAVDYSAVTTFIPFLGCLLITRGLIRIARRQPCPSDNFPFFRSTDQLNIALGLFGTLWGIIVIGYFKLETVSMADLMQCLHTALFSTLTAVVWVFMIDHPLVRPWMRRELAAANLVEDEESDLVAAVESLTSKLHAASEAFEAREKAFEEAFAKRQAEAEAAFAKRQAEIDEALTRRQAEADAAMAKRQADYDAAASKRIDEMRRANEEETARHRRETEELSKIVAAARADVQEIEKTRQAAVKDAEAQSARADRAEAKLNSVAKLLG